VKVQVQTRAATGEERSPLISACQGLLALV